MRSTLWMRMAVVGAVWLAAVSWAAAQTSLVSTGAVWKYLADGSDQGTLWREPGFVDDSWLSGAAQIGFGDGDEVTNVGTNRLIVTYYFRQAFSVGNPGDYTNLVVRMRRDDGAVVYLNGLEVFRSNLPEGAVNFSTFALQAAPDDGDALIGSVVPTAALLPGANLIAVEVHQNGTNSSDISFDLELLGNFDVSQFIPPTVSISSPTNGAVIVASTVTVNVTANDADGVVNSVELFANGISLGTDTTTPFNFTGGPIPAGSYTLTAVATDNQRLSATSAPVTITVEAPPPTLVASGSTWNYLNDGTDQGTLWREPGFDDSAWPSGPGELGFGDGDEATNIGTNGAIITTYFRHTFNPGSLAGYTNLAVILRRDDGAVVYINGIEVFRSNMPGGAIGWGTSASATAGDDGDNSFTNFIAPSALVANIDNVIAVEVHQFGTGSSDLSFDLSLLANVKPPPPIPPTVAISSPANNATIGALNVTINATATDPDSTIVQVQFFQSGSLLGTDTEAPYSAIWMNVSPGQYTLRAIALDSQGLMATSAPVVVTIVPPPSTLVPFGASWRYLDDGGVSLGGEWYSFFYDDSAWSIGAAELGFGDNDETTFLRATNSLGQPNIAYYFRHTFNVDDVSSVSNIVVRLARDDGAVVYLNGLEVFRNNITNDISDPITPLTLAAATVEDSPIVATSIDLTLGAAVLNPGANVIAVEVHQASVDSSDVSFDLELRPNIPPTAPVVMLTAPTNGAAFLSTEIVNLAATASDLDGIIERVQFFVDGVQVGTDDMTDPYGRPATDLIPGNRVLTAVATDNTGLSVTSAPVTIRVTAGPVISTLIASNSVWKYLDTGVDQGTAWRAFDFDDSGWLMGPAQLGFGDNDEATLITSNAVNVTYYFRHAFEVANAASYTNLVFGVQRDDGAVAYLNGAELFRMNMPATAITFMTRASAGTTSETTFFPTNVVPAAGLLREGLNVLAVEVHQNSSTSTDVSFNLQMLGYARPALGPRLTIAIDGSDVVIGWSPSGGVLEVADDPDGGPWNPIAGATNPQRITGAVGGVAATKFYRIRQ